MGARRPTRDAARRFGQEDGYVLRAPKASDEAPCPLPLAKHRPSGSTQGASGPARDARIALQYRRESEEAGIVTEGFFSRGFTGRRRQTDDARLPPGQYLEDGFPVLSAGPTPRTPLEEWDFSLVGEVDEPKRWRFSEILRASGTPRVSTPTMARSSSEAAFFSRISCEMRRSERSIPSGVNVTVTATVIT